VGAVDGATHTQKDDVERNGGSLENVAQAFVLFLCGVQLVLRYMLEQGACSFILPRPSGL